jgi:hypothetical protein
MNRIPAPTKFFFGTSSIDHGKKDEKESPNFAELEFDSENMKALFVFVSLIGDNDS